MGKRATGLKSLLKFFGKPPEKTITEIQISHEGAKFRVALKRVASARRYTLRVRSATRDIVLTMPVKASLRQAQQFAQNHAEWLAERLARLPQQLLFAPGAKFPFAASRMCSGTARRPPIAQEDEDPSGST